MIRSASDDHRSAAASPSRAHNGSGPRAHPHRTTAGEKRPPASPDNHHHHATAASKPGGGGNQLETKSSAETETAGAAEKVSLEAFDWPRIYLSLSRKEKEDDFLAMKGTKLPQRPKKRAKNVDKALQVRLFLFPSPPPPTPPSTTTTSLLIN